jgi:hypothetical protein
MGVEVDDRRPDTTTTAAATFAPDAGNECPETPRPGQGEDRVGYDLGVDLGTKYAAAATSGSGRRVAHDRPPRAVTTGPGPRHPPWVSSQAASSARIRSAIGASPQRAK